MADIWEEEEPIAIQSNTYYNNDRSYNNRRTRGDNFNRDGQQSRDGFRSNNRWSRDDRNQQQGTDYKTTNIKVPSNCVGRIIGHN